MKKTSFLFIIALLIGAGSLTSAKRYRFSYPSRGDSNTERHGVEDHLELLERQRARKTAKTPEEREKYVHQYFGSPPAPFNKKGEWEGTVHYDWGWCK